MSDGALASGGKRPNTTSLLVQCILEEFEGTPVEPVLRKYWSDSAGTHFLSQHLVLRLTKNTRPSICQSALR